MSQSTQKAPGAILGTMGRERRLNIGGMPSAPTVLCLCALLGAAIAVASGVYTIAALREGLLANRLDGWWVPAGTVLLGLASLLVLLPLARAYAR
ncbi:hypothetical protein [Pandoraea faecigallinarum]|uniref:hypothetical protein n=1 Tax=Pandoraea faecigallinarum TaxID=656179 RepID=UPI00064BF85E|nr:hypothetical protein [Pandoraea faecigallinarum]